MRVFDIETMGTDAEAKICSIGWTDIINDEVTQTRHLLIHWNGENQDGRTIDAEARDFWDNQLIENPEAAEQIHGLQQRITLEQALHVFMDCYRKTFNGTEVPVASKGPEFDAAILRDASKQLDIPIYHYRHNQSVRTYELIAKSLGLKPRELAPPEQITHHAGFDSLREAKLVLGVTKHIMHLNTHHIPLEDMPY